MHIDIVFDDAFAPVARNHKEHDRHDDSASGTESDGHSCSVAKDLGA
jgi:hypothetical protein